MKENLESKNERIEQITFEWEKNLKDIKDIRLKFVKENNNSYLSAYWIAFYSGSLPLDSLNFYYNNLDLKVKRSLYGEKVLKTIELMSRDANSDPGDRAFNFELINEKDKIISLESFKGKYVLLDFWASWCAPCRKENPDLKKLYNKYHPKGLEVIGLSYDRDKEKWNQAIQDDSLEIWSHVFIGKQAELISVEYNIKTLPAYILIDREGYIVERYLDTGSDGKNLGDLEKLLENIVFQDQ